MLRSKVETINGDRRARREGDPGRAVGGVGPARDQGPPPAGGRYVRDDRGRHRRGLPRLRRLSDHAGDRHRRVHVQALAPGRRVLHAVRGRAGRHARLRGCEPRWPQGDDGDVGARLHADARRLRLVHHQRDPAGGRRCHAGGADQRHHGSAGPGRVLHRALREPRRQLRDDRALAVVGAGSVLADDRRLQPGRALPHAGDDPHRSGHLGHVGRPVHPRRLRRPRLRDPAQAQPHDAVLSGGQRRPRRAAERDRPRDRRVRVCLHAYRRGLRHRGDGSAVGSDVPSRQQDPTSSR